jgi:thioredoxin reductase
MKSICPVAIVGGGPYGLSLAAHLRKNKVSYRIFGRPMDFWLKQMPAGMSLKSDGFASNLYDPDGKFTLRQFCQERGIEYADIGIPVRLDTFNAYGLAFQAALVPDLDKRMVVSVARDAQGFVVLLDDGEEIRAQNVVLAVGITHFPSIPSVLAALPPHLLTHSSQHHDLTQFKGRSVAVVGGGSSATDLVALLEAAGAMPQMIARRSSLTFNEHPGPAREFSSSFWHQIMEPMSGIGPGWRYKIFGDAPWLFRYLPQQLRHRVVRRSHGPAGAWFVRDKIENRPHVLLGQTIERAEAQGDRIQLEMRSLDNSRKQVSSDHVIAATGYKVDIRRLPFLSAEIQSNIRVAENTPVLSASFQSSIPGLYFVGTVSANCFGPVMRFAFGAGFTAQRLSRALSARVQRRRHEPSYHTSPKPL